MRLWKTLNIVVSIFFASSSAESNVSFSFSPDGEVVLETEETVTIRGQGEINDAQLGEVYAHIQDNEIAQIVDCGNSTVLLEMTTCGERNVSRESATPTSRNCFNISFQVEGVFLGRTRIYFYNGTGAESGKASGTFYDEYRVVVLRQYSIFTELFIYVLIALLFLNTIGYGCAIDLHVMRAILKKPAGPAIGLGCQYILNPLLSYGLAKLYGLPSAMAMGLFAVGCSPGGGSSNLWTYLLGGDLNLSILMTLISLTASLGLMPLWLFTLGRTLIPDDFDIPYQNVFYSIAGLVVPCFLGILIKRFHPKLAKRIEKIIKPLALLIILFILAVGIYANRYMFVLMKDWRVLVSGLTLPLITYTASATIAWICRQPKQRIITISIETAVQNTAIAIVMLTLSYPQPDADIAAVMPVASTMFTPTPLYIIFLCMTIRKRWRKKKYILPKTGKQDSNTDISTVSYGISNGSATLTTATEKIEDFNI